MVRCKNCGKRYTYEGGCCPKCGAFNRRPRRTTIGADGEVHHLNDQGTYDGVVPEHGGRKICFEEEQCFEKQVEYPKRWQKRANRRNPAEAFQTPHTAQELENELRKLGDRMTKKAQKTSSNKIIGVAAVFSVLMMLIPAILGFVLESFDHNEPSDPPTEYYVGPSEIFESSDDEMCVVDCRLVKLDDGSGEYQLAIKSEWDHNSDMTFCCTYENGDYLQYGVYSTEHNEEDGMFHYTYRFADMESAKYCMLRVEDWFDEEIVWVVLP